MSGLQLPNFWKSQDDLRWIQVTSAATTTTQQQPQQQQPQQQPYPLPPNLPVIETPPAPLVGTEYLSIGLFPPLGSVIYKLERQLGRGASGAVYQAYQSGFERDKFALKIFDLRPGETSQMLEVRVKREFLISQQLRTRLTPVEQKDVLLASGIGVVNDSEFYISRRVIIYPFVDSVTVLEFLDEMDKMRADPTLNKIWALQATSLAKQLCLIIGRINKLGVYHRDIKLDNLIIDRIDPRFTPVTDGCVRLIDFGNACASDVFNREILVDNELTTCESENQRLVATYVCNIKYADPRTFVERSDEVPSDERSLREVRQRLSDRFFAVFYPSALVATLWPEFEAYAVAVCIVEILDPNARRASSRVAFEVPKFAAGRKTSSKETVLFEKVPTNKFTSLFKYLTGNNSQRDLLQAADQLEKIYDVLYTFEKTTDQLNAHLPAVRTYHQQQRAQSVVDANKPMVPAMFEPNQSVLARQEEAKKRKREELVPQNLATTTTTTTTTTSTTTTQEQPQQRRRTENVDDDNP